MLSEKAKRPYVSLVEMQSLIDLDAQNQVNRPATFVMSQSELPSALTVSRHIRYHALGVEDFGVAVADSLHAFVKYMFDIDWKLPEL